MRNRIAGAGVLIGAVIGFPAYSLNLYFTGNWYSLLHSYSLGMALGIVSFCWFIVALILSARIRFLDRLVGHDRVLMVHGYLALAALICAVGHVGFKYYYSFSPNLQTAPGLAAMILFTLIAAATVLFMVEGPWLRLRPLAHLRTNVLRTGKADYSLLKLWHNLTSLACALVALHVILASATQETFVRTAFMGGWAAVGLVLYGYHKLFRPLRARKKRHAISRITPKGPGIVEIRVPGALRGHRAGQFIYLRILSSSCGTEEHPFTVSSCPADPEIAVTIKNLGNYTSRMGSIVPGTAVIIDGPYGVFTPVQNGRAHLFVAGGIGITPFMSILDDWRNRGGIKYPTTLLWSCRTEEEMIGKSAFERLAQEQDGFSFVPVLSRSGLQSRRIDAALLSTLVSDSIRSTVAVYVCGPEQLRRATFQILRSLGVPARNLHYERFSF